MKKSNLLILSAIVSISSMNSASAFERREGGRANGGEQNQDTTNDRGERGGQQGDRGERGDRGGQQGDRSGQQGDRGDRSGPQGERGERGGQQGDRGNRGGDLPPSNPTPPVVSTPPPAPRTPPPAPVVTAPAPRNPAPAPVVTAPSIPSRNDDRSDRGSRGGHQTDRNDRGDRFGTGSRDDRFDRGPRDDGGGFGGIRDDRFGNGPRNDRFDNGPRGHRPPPPVFEPGRGEWANRGPSQWNRRRANHQWNMGIRFRDRAPRWNNNWTNWNRNWESRQRFVQNRRPVRFSHMRWNSYWRVSLNVNYSRDYVFSPPYPRYNDDFYYAEYDWNGNGDPQPYYMEADVEEYLNIRSAPNANGFYNICGQLPAGSVVPVVSSVRSAFGADRTWAMIRVDADVRDYITNPDCFRSPYVFTAMDFLK